MFEIGQQVLCIKEGGWEGSFTDEILRSNNVPLKGYIYTIASIEYFRFPKKGGEVFLNLVEIKSLHCWDALRFRPIKKTDISVFEKLLNTQSKEFTFIEE